MPTDLLQLIASHPAIAELSRELLARRRCVATNAVGSCASLISGALAKLAGRIVVLVTAHLDDADEAADELAGLGVPVLHLPAIEALPGESGASAELFADRLACVQAVLTLRGPAVVLCPIQSLMQLVPPPSRLEALTRTVRTGGGVKLAELVHWLGAAGYDRVEAVDEPGQFALRGGILDVFPPGGAGGGDAEVVSGTPVRLDFFGDTVDRISEFDLETMGTDRAVAGVRFTAVNAAMTGGVGGVNFLELVPADALALLSETMEVVEQGRGYFERVTDERGVIGPPAVLKVLESRFHGFAEINQFSAGATAAEARVEIPASPLPTFPHDAEQAVKELAQLEGRVVVCAQNQGELRRLGELLAEFAPGARERIESRELYLHRGFVWRQEETERQRDEETERQRDEETERQRDEETERQRDEETERPSLRSFVSSPLALVPYHELLNRFTVRRRVNRLRSSRAMDTFLDFQPGDYVVHAEHGIALFSGLTMMKPREVPHAPSARTREQEPEEYLVLEFAAKSRLYVPAVQIDKVQKYIGGFSGKPPLSSLGGQKWKTQKERVAESVRDLAAELLRVRAAREHIPGITYPPDTPWQKEFEAEFPYEETEDQLAALVEIKKDMHSPRPMDRLICGDVGFGKTELAIRAAFKACEYGRQVAVLVPTTVLAEQHERTFKSRFAGYPFRVESVSRFKTGGEVAKVLTDLRKGHVDLIIGTHRLLSGDVRFSDLGLVIVDEEQRFGVEHKEQLLRLRLTVDVLTLSATPIPRTLHMALLGIRDISSLTTPPLDRRAIVTEVIPYNPHRLRQAIARELAREGQVFYIHNRVHDITSVADDVRKLAPDARIVVGHGQMPPHELEEVMLTFIRREADILVSTTIVESGIDIPSANTMIIDNADRFGLADLHQLRGRVGRSKHRAYCYLLLPDDRAIKEIAQKRLKAIEQYSMLGAGFKIAMRDLEIRGAGNILGPEQSGHIAAVGYDMYCQLLEGAVRELRQEAPPAVASGTSIEIGVSGTIPRNYIASDQRRLEAYRRIATATDAAALAGVRWDIIAAYGEPPRATQRLFDLAEIRIAAASLGVRTITIRDKDVVFLARAAEPVAAALGANAAGAADQATVRPLPPKSPGADAEVYFRPPGAYFEPETLLRVLRRRFGLLAPEPARKEARPRLAPRK